MSFFAQVHASKHLHQTEKKNFLILHYIEPFSLKIDISVINESRSRFLSILKVQSFCTYEPFSYKDTGLQNQSELQLIEVKKVALVIAFWYKWSEEKVLFLTLFVPSIKCQKFVMISHRLSTSTFLFLISSFKFRNCYVT